MYMYSCWNTSVQTTTPRQKTVPPRGWMSFFILSSVTSSTKCYIYMYMYVLIEGNEFVLQITQLAIIANWSIVHFDIRWPIL